jgi:hypothetical protein
MRMETIKENLHFIIDNFDDDDFLSTIYEILQAKQKQHAGEIWKSLAEEQQKEIIQAASDIEKSNKQITHDSMIEKNKKWLGK